MSVWRQPIPVAALICLGLAGCDRSETLAPKHFDNARGVEQSAALGEISSAAAALSVRSFGAEIGGSPYEQALRCRGAGEVVLEAIRQLRAAQSREIEALIAANRRFEARAEALASSEPSAPNALENDIRGAVADAQADRSRQVSILIGCIRRLEDDEG